MAGSLAKEKGTGVRGSRGGPRRAAGVGQSCCIVEGGSRGESKFAGENGFRRGFRERRSSPTGDGGEWQSSPN